MNTIINRNERTISNKTTSPMINNLRETGYQVPWNIQYRVENAEQDVFEAIDALRATLDHLASDYQQAPWATTARETNSIGRASDGLAFQASQITLALHRLHTLVDATAEKITSEASA